LLFVPADSARKLAKSLSCAADVLIFDLEDAVAPDQKSAARGTLSEFLAGHRERLGHKWFVRINAFDTGLALADLAAVMPHHPDGIVLPKCRDGADVQKLADYLDAMEVIYPPREPACILPIVTESAEAVFGLSAYRHPSPRLWGMMWGAEDLSADLGAGSNRDDDGWRAPYQLARSLCLLAATRAGVFAIDAVSVALDSPDALALEASEAKRDGFAGKAAIHPDQVDIINRRFAPTADEIAQAKKIVAALAAGGTVAVDGRMVDRPHLRWAERLLAGTQGEPAGE
jgi:citrate lyase subunit beta/citryl-CoA lyase